MPRLCSEADRAEIAGNQRDDRSGDRKLVDHPRRTLRDHIQRGRPHLEHFRNTLLEDGVWIEKRAGLHSRNSFQDTNSSDYLDYADIVNAIAAGRMTTRDPLAAALAALATVINLRWMPRSYLTEANPDVLDMCGKHAWIVRDVTAQLIGMQATALSAGGESRGISAWQLGSSL